ncbi:MAG: XdhC/CoxI family protein [Elusimicrobiota bacterium]
MMEENIIKILSDAISERKNAAFITIISSGGSTPRDAGSKMIVYENGSIAGTIGGGKIEALAIKTALDCLRKGEGGKFVFDLTPKGIGMACMGKVEIFIDIYKTPLKVFICGGGHVAKQLAKVLDIAGFPYAVADDREEFANKNNFPGAYEIINEFPDKAFKKAKIDSDTYVVIMTRGHMLDAECLIEAVKTKAAYIGMIGSASKVRTVMSDLKKKGVKIDKRVYSPIGLDLGGKTPGEIAVSVAAEILKIHYGRSGNHMSVNSEAK